MKTHLISQGFHSSRRSLIKSWWLLAVLAILMASCGKEKTEEPETQTIRPVKLLTLESRGNLSEYRFPATVRASQRVDMAFQVPGTLMELPVKESQTVNEKQLLARLNPKDYETSLRTAQGQLEKAKAFLNRAKSDYTRILNIQQEDPGATSQTMVDRRREAMDKARAEIKSAQAGVDGATDQLSYTSLQAPFSGVIAKRYVDNFQEVQAKQPIVSVQDISQIELLLDVPENIMATVEKGTAKAFAEFAADPGKQYSLQFKEVSAEADPKTQTYRMVAIMSAPEKINVLPGMTANVLARISKIGAGEDQYEVPALSVFADEAGTSHVWVLNPDTMTVHKRQVTTGNLTGADKIVILKGLEPGEKIAVTGVAQLREGMQVSDLSQLEGFE